MVERFAVICAVIFAFGVTYRFLWWLEWELMREVREENRRKRKRGGDE